MCGFAGVAGRPGSTPVGEALLREMGRCLVHRGPDDSGHHIGSGIGLAHRRLSIVDRSERGHQPMANDDESLWIVFNGEMYNHAEQRRTLEAKGIRFRSGSDTEVVLRLYEAFGDDCLARIRGMFAFAIWDARAHRLFAARDRFGQKPFYYRETSGGLAFASEIKALLRDPGCPREVDLEAIHHYLSFDYVPAPSTGFQGIHELPPAHCLSYQDGRLELTRYWALSHRPDPALALRSSADLAMELRERLCEAVQMRLMGEVPLGIFLSGGVDSNVITAVVRRLLKQPVKTFSIGFEEADFDESGPARRSAEHFGAEHFEYPVRPDIVSLLPRLVAHHDQPFGDPSTIPCWALAGEASREITIALGGDGGDEAFAGYDRYVLGAKAARIARLPARIRRLLHFTLRRAPLSRAGWDNPLRAAERLLSLPSLDPGALFARWLVHVDHESKRDLYSDDLWSELAGDASEARVEADWNAAEADDPLSRSLAVDTGDYLANDILMKVDMATMAHSLEGRSPFLDHELMEFAAGLPAQEKLRGLETKSILRRAFEDLLPREILHRPKRGFGLPIDRWLRSELREMTRDQLLGSRALSRGYFRPQAIERMLDEHDRGERPWQYAIWNLLVLELWHEQTIDASALPV